MAAVIVSSGRKLSSVHNLLALVGVVALAAVGGWLLKRLPAMRRG